MPVSGPVRAWYASRIFARSTRTSVPENFRPLPGADGRSTVEGCAGGGKNILELAVRVADGVVVDVRAACGLCNPAMYVAADLVCDEARGRRATDLLALDPLAPSTLDACFARLAAEGEGDARPGAGSVPPRPEDAREKLQYAFVALQQALRAARGEPLPPVPRVAPPRDGSPEDTEDDRG